MTGPPRPAALPGTPTLSLAVHPTAVTARRRSRAQLTVINTGPEAVRAWPVGIEADDAVRTRFSTPSVLLAPGEHRRLEVTLRRRGLRGRSRARMVTLAAILGEPDGPAPDPGALAGLLPSAFDGQLRVVEDGRLVHAPGAPGAILPRITVNGGSGLFGRIALLVLALAAVAIVVVRTVGTDHGVKVPAVIGEPDVATATRVLEQHGLSVAPEVSLRQTATVPPGSVIGQRPADGQRTDRAQPVALEVATGVGRVGIPDLRGKTAAAADAAVRRAGLSVGQISPRRTTAADRVALQIPAAFLSAAPGTPVAIFLSPTASEAAGATGPVPTVGAGSRVPTLRGRSVLDATHALADLGLVPKVIRRVDAAAPGTLLGTRPAAGASVKPGAVVRLLVSGGTPHLAFDTGAVVRLLDPVTGKTTREAAPPQAKAVEPSWTPSGQQVVYRVGRRLLLASSKLGDSGRVLYDGPEQYVLPTFSQSIAHATIALVQRKNGDGDLCFAAVGRGRITPTCLPDNGWDLGRQVSWRKDGREVLVFGVRHKKSKRFGILRFRTTTPFSTKAANWHGSVATDISTPGRGAIAAAFSPSGGHVALVSNIGTPRFQLTITTPGALKHPRERALPVRACEVAWRPDGDEVAVVQSDDACQTQLGDIVRVDVRQPRRVVTVATGARHPSYQSPVDVTPKAAP